MIPFLDLKSYNDQYRSEFERAFQQFLESGRYILDDQVKSFEHDFANYCGTEYCIGTANGLDALILIFKGYIELGKINKGDEIIVPANTYIASIISIIHAGLTPVLVEPDPNTFNLAPLEIESAVNSKTRAILAIHLYGQLADMMAIKTVAANHGLLIIEDAAQAHGAMDDNGKFAGNLGDAAAFSFYPSKNLGALGDAGCVTTNDSELADLVAKLRNYGASSKYVNDHVGFNSRLDEIQALFLNIKLKHLDDDNDKRRKIARIYLNGVINEKIKLPYYSNSNDHVFHQFVVLVDDRKNFIEYLSVNKVGSLIHYPIAPHHQDALKEYSQLSLPITENIHNCIVSIPLNPILTIDQVESIVELLNAY